MVYYKRLLSSLFILTLIATLSACSHSTTNTSTKETQKVTATPAKKVESKAQKTKDQNETLIQVNQQLDELFTPEIGLF